MRTVQVFYQVGLIYAIVVDGYDRQVRILLHGIKIFLVLLQIFFGLNDFYAVVLDKFNDVFREFWNIAFEQCKHDMIFKTCFLFN